MSTTPGVKASNGAKTYISKHQNDRLQDGLETLCRTDDPPKPGMILLQCNLVNKVSDLVDKHLKTDTITCHLWLLRDMSPSNKDQHEQPQVPGLGYPDCFSFGEESHTLCQNKARRTRFLKNTPARWERP